MPLRPRDGCRARAGRTVPPPQMRERQNLMRQWMLVPVADQHDHIRHFHAVDLRRKLAEPGAQAPVERAYVVAVSALASPARSSLCRMRPLNCRMARTASVT